VALQASGQMDKAADYSKVVVAFKNGSPIKLDEVARIYDSVENDKIASWLNGDRSIVLASRSSPMPTPWRWSIHPGETAGIARADPTVGLDQRADGSLDLDPPGVADVEETLLIAISLVILVIFLFLRSHPPRSYRHWPFRSPCSEPAP